MTNFVPAYDVLYDVSTAPFEPNVFSIIFTGVGFGLGLWGYMYPTRRWHRAGAVAMIVLSLLSGIWTNWVLWSSHEQLRAEYVARNFETVEGEVTEFRLGRRDCGQVTFIVSGRLFQLKPKCEVFAGYQGRNMPDLLNRCVRVDVVALRSMQRIAWIGTRTGECGGN